MPWSHWVTVTSPVRSVPGRIPIFVDDSMGVDWWHAKTSHFPNSCPINSFWEGVYQTLLKQYSNENGIPLWIVLYTIPLQDHVSTLALHGLPWAWSIFKCLYPRREDINKKSSFINRKQLSILFPVYKTTFRAFRASCDDNLDFRIDSARLW